MAISRDKFIIVPNSSLDLHPLYLLEGEVEGEVSKDVKGETDFVVEIIADDDELSWKWSSCSCTACVVDEEFCWADFEKFVNESAAVTFLVEVVVDNSGRFKSRMDMSEQPTKCSWTGPHPTQLILRSLSKPFNKINLKS